MASYLDVPCKPWEPSLYDHVISTLQTLITGRVSDPCGEFEVASLETKALHAAHYKRRIAELSGAAAAEATAPAEFSEAGLSRARTLAARFAVDRDEEGAPVTRECVPTADVCAEARLLALCNAGPGIHEAVRADAALQRLAAAALVGSEALGATVAEVALWGTLQGRVGDYLIAQCVGESAEELAEGAVESGKVDAPGTGDNRYIYYALPSESDSVSGASPLAGWIRLPHATRARVAVAERTSKFLTGHPDATVTTAPAFHGREIDYLRALIALVSRSHLQARGLFTRNEEGEVVRADSEDFRPPSVEDFRSLRGFVSVGELACARAVTSSGCATSSAASSSTTGRLGAGSATQGWDPVDLVDLALEELAGVAARSRSWPGLVSAVSTVAPGRVVNYYFGLGVRRQRASAGVPCEFPPMISDFDEVGVVPEPHEAPPVVEEAED